MFNFLRLQSLFSNHESRGCSKFRLIESPIKYIKYVIYIFKKIKWLRNYGGHFREKYVIISVIKTNLNSSPFVEMNNDEIH